MASIAGSSPLTRGKLPNLTIPSLTNRLIPAHAGKTPGRLGGPWSVRAHPRSRGENPPMLFDGLKSLGSSPLTRGKRPGLAWAGLGWGLIPAHAGKTGKLDDTKHALTAHPRSRGENGQPIVDLIINVGSSPLTRGKPRGQRQSTGGAWAHPRSRGENRWAVDTLGPTGGSSPLTRGKPQTGDQDDDQAGLIPAHAGKTVAAGLRPLRTGAHPRSRGENWFADAARGVAEGSSPLTRGKHRKRARLSPRLGLIPAHAGKTGRSVAHRSVRRAHPRSRGENTFHWRPQEMDPGSSPLTRGKREDRAREVLGGGLIPAHAGKTSPAAPSLSHRRAHPRSRGENRGQHGDDLSVLGSSPLTRGKLLYLGFTFRPLRLIPAHAGKTIAPIRSWM